MSWGLIQNSLLVAASTMCLACVLGSAFAASAAALPRGARAWASAAAILTLILPPFLVSNAWLNYFGLNGTWRHYLDFNVYSLPGTVLLLTLQLWPVASLLLAGAIMRVDAAYLEQEPLLRRLNLIRYLVWPVCRPALGFSALLIFVLALNNFSVPVLLQTKVFPEEVWLSFNTRFDYGEALRLSWPLVLAPLALLALFRHRPNQFLARNAEFPHRLWRARLGILLPVWAIVSILTLLLALGLPLAQLISSSRTWAELIPAIRAGQSALQNTLWFAILTAAIVLGLGITGARLRVGFIGWLFFLTPGVLVGIALIRVFNRPLLAGFYQSTGIVLLAFTLRYFAIGWAAARAAVAQEDNSLRDVVRVLGGSRWQQFRLAQWPQSQGVLFAGFYLVYLLGVWEVETLILIVPPGRETLALRIFNMLHYGHAGQVDALCVWMLALGLLPLVVYAASTGLRRLRPGRLASLGLLVLAGCGSGPANSTKVQSQIFSSVQVFGSRGTGAGEFNKPRSIAVDRQDNFYVVDMTGRVQKFDPEGKFLLSWQMPQTDKGKPKGMGLDSDGNIIVVEPHYSRVNHFSPEGKLVAQWGVNGTNRGQLYFPRSVGVNSRGEIYLSEYGMVERIQHFSHLGTNFIESVGQPGTGPGDLNRGEGIGVAPDDSVFEADSCNHRIQVFSPQGKLIASFGSAGSGPNQLSYPYDVQVDALGYRFVCEFGNSRVQIFDPQNRSIEILGEAGGDPGQMNNPWAIALDSRGNLYVADSLNHRVQKFLRREPLPRRTAKPGVSLTAR